MHVILIFPGCLRSIRLFIIKNIIIQRAGGLASTSSVEDNSTILTLSTFHNKPLPFPCFLAGQTHTSLLRQNSAVLSHLLHYAY